MLSGGYTAGMILAILSDIHANLEAFTEVLAEIDRRAPDRVISLGDNIGYGPDPEPVMELIRSRQIASIAGNHEMVVQRPRLINWFNPVARIAVNYTLAALSEESKRTITGLPKLLCENELRFVHGAPLASVFLYLFQLTESNLKKKLSLMKERICFAGHTHDLGMTVFDGIRLENSRIRQGSIYLDTSKKTLINTGSVGQPRDGDPSAKCLFLDTEKNLLDICYLPYDHEKTAAKILQAGLPRQYAEKLSLTFDD